jgi:uncharacterized protein
LSQDNKFARLSALRPARKIESPYARASLPVAEGNSLANLLGARINRNRFGEHLSVTQWYATPEMCANDARSFSLLVPQLADERECSAAADPGRWLFLDTETTGLAGGTGTYAFLVGIAWWDAGGLQIEQFFMRDLDEEHSLLLELSERMAQRPVLVTFNGKCFDWPLLETRYRMTRSIPAFTPEVHLDMLHPARQLWKLRLGTVRLKDLERCVLAERGRSLDLSRHDDIDSSLIPQIYFDYLRGSPAEPLVGIFRHNQMDLRGLAALAGKIFSLLDDGNDTINAEGRDTREATELLGLSRLLRRQGRVGRARELYESALRFGLPPFVERLAQRELAQLAKQELDYSRAISLWESLRRAPRSIKRAGSPGVAKDFQKVFETAIEAAEQLAVYYEHRVKQPDRALELIRAAVADLRKEQLNSRCSRERTVKMESRLSRRLARLERRCAGTQLFVLPPARNPSGSNMI